MLRYKLSRHHARKRARGAAARVHERGDAPPAAERRANDEEADTLAPSAVAQPDHWMQELHDNCEQAIAAARRIQKNSRRAGAARQAVHTNTSRAGVACRATAADPRPVVACTACRGEFVASTTLAFLGVPCECLPRNPEYVCWQCNAAWRPNRVATFAEPALAATPISAEALRRVATDSEATLFFVSLLLRLKQGWAAATRSLPRMREHLCTLAHAGYISIGQVAHVKPRALVELLLRVKWRREQFVPSDRFAAQSTEGKRAVYVALAMHLLAMGNGDGDEHRLAAARLLEEHMVPK